MVKGSWLAVFPATVTYTVPAVAIAVLGTNTEAVVELVTLALVVKVPNVTCIPELKPAPIRFSVNPGPPAAAVVGEMELKVGPVGAVTVNENWLDWPFVLSTT